MYKYVVSALVAALILAGLALDWMHNRVGVAQDRAVAAEKQAGEYLGSLNDLNRAYEDLAAQAKAEREAQAKRSKAQGTVRDNTATAKKELQDEYPKHTWSTEPIPDPIRLRLEQASRRNQGTGPGLSPE